ncbi:MAG: alpha/beta hydrolase [Ruminococcus sp.]|nr:alpha/beta hydrolase [Ruminococcus sp.]
MKKKAGMKKIVIRILVAFLAVVLLVVGGFEFYCRVINRRSFMAGVVDLSLALEHRKDKFEYLDACNEYIEEKAKTNKEPVVIDNAKYGISLREERHDSLQAFIYNDQEHPAQTVFYFHGGGYINQPNNLQTAFAAQTAKETGCEVVLMVYPKLPVYDCETCYKLCVEYYENYLKANDCGKIIIMGDSAGGGLALGFAEVLRDKGDVCPEELILISPGVDMTLTNSDIQSHVANDPMLGIDGVRRLGEVWANGLSTKDPRVSPIYGDLSGLGRVTLTTGTWEILYPDILLLSKKMEEAGVDCNLIIGERMIHCYPICPIPEANPVREEIWNAIVRTENDG